MATITASLFSALDGVVDPMLGNWHFPYFNDEMGEAVGGTHDADVMLFGRVTYDSFAGAWPEREAAGGEDAPFAKQLGDMRKVVASRSRLSFTWRNSEQLDGDLVEAVTALKNDPTVNRIALSGSVSVVRQLLDAGLLDELHLFVHPATAGSGLRLFDDGAPPRFLKLLAAQPFRTGVVHLTYAPDPEPPTGTYDDAKKTLAAE
jgi:dihydrofolate reductase